MQDPATNTLNQAKVNRSSHKMDNPSHKSRTKTPLQERIIAAKKAHPDLNNKQIAAIIGTTRENTSRTLTQYGVDMGAVEAYQKHRADIFDGVCSRLLASVTDSDINKASLMQRMASVGVLYDKMRIERGLSDGTSKPLVMIQIAGTQQSVTIGQPTNTTILHDNVTDSDATDQGEVGSAAKPTI